MAGIARVGDTASGTCSSHKTVQSVTGTITTGYAHGTCDDLSIARIGDTVTFNCGHTGIITTGADYSEADGIKIAVLGSQVGPGSGNIAATITSCSPNSTAI